MNCQFGFWAWKTLSGSRIYDLRKRGFAPIAICSTWRTGTIVCLFRSWAVNHDVNLCGSNAFVEILVIDPLFAGSSNFFSWHNFANSGSHRGNGQMPSAGLVSVIPQVIFILALGRSSFRFEDPKKRIVSFYFKSPAICFWKENLRLLQWSSALGCHGVPSCEPGLRRLLFVTSRQLAGRFRLLVGALGQNHWPEHGSAIVWNNLRRFVSPGAARQHCFLFRLLPGRQQIRLGDLRSCGSFPPGSNWPWHAQLGCGRGVISHFPPTSSEQGGLAANTCCNRRNDSWRLVIFGDTWDVFSIEGTAGAKKTHGDHLGPIECGHFSYHSRDRNWASLCSDLGNLELTTLRRGSLTFPLRSPPHTDAGWSRRLVRDNSHSEAFGIASICCPQTFGLAHNLRVMRYDQISWRVFTITQGLLEFAHGPERCFTRPFNWLDPNRTMHSASCLSRLSFTFAFDCWRWASAMLHFVSPCLGSCGPYGCKSFCDGSSEGSFMCK